ncbi:MAG: ABC transporter transmembrane domain-containing protein [Microthrixaceae bacterium]
MPMAVSVLGAVAFAAAAVGATAVLGRATDEVVGPAFGRGVSTTTLRTWSVALVAVGAGRGLSVVVRRYFAAMLEARMQAGLRTQVVDKYLTAPMSFHQTRRPGELLAHADADVIGTTTVIKPLPFSIGLVALVVFAFVSLILVDPVFALVAACLFPF